MKATKKQKARLEYLRTELRAERISYEELMELQDLAEYIEPGDVELLEPAGVPEHDHKIILSDALSADEYLNEKESWGIFERSDGFYEIEALDDGIKNWDDDMALSFVISQAIKGSKRHARALWADGRECGNKKIYPSANYLPIDLTE